jgi:hypothetical protein
MALDAARRAEAVMQVLLAELVVALLRGTRGELEPALGREGPHGAELGADRTVAFQRARQVELDGESHGTAVAASGIGRGVGHGFLLKIWIRLGYFLSIPIERADPVSLTGPTTPAVTSCEERAAIVCFGMHASAA